MRIIGKKRLSIPRGPPFSEHVLSSSLAVVAKQSEGHIVTSWLGWARCNPPVVQAGAGCLQGNLTRGHRDDIA